MADFPSLGSLRSSEVPQDKPNISSIHRQASKVMYCLFKNMNTDGSLNYEPHDGSTKFPLLNQRKIRMILDKRKDKARTPMPRMTKTTMVFQVNREI